MSDGKTGLLQTARQSLADLAPGDDDPPAEQEIAAFLAALFDVALVYGADPAAVGALGAFVNETAPDIRKLVVPLSFYPGELLDSFEGIWEDDEWVQLCRRRSALQFFLDLYGGSEAWSVMDAIREASVALDAYIRERGMLEGCLSDEEIDPAIPRTHWWWWLPNQA
jgi:hypothetical protein